MRPWGGSAERWATVARGCRSFLCYVAAAGVVVLAYLAISSYGSTLSAPVGTAVAVAGGADGRVDVVSRVLLALLIVIALARVLGAVCQYFKQPVVIGEIAAGIALGPSILGRVAPDAFHYVFAPGVPSFLDVISQLGIVFYMFLVGLTLDYRLLGVRGRAAIAVSQSSMVVPFLMGALLALPLYPMLSSKDVSFTSFSLFLGVSMAVTAFPVLARIVTDRNLQSTYIGTMALTCAAAGDIAAWCVLALVVGIARGDAGGAGVTLALALVFVAVMAFVLRPLMARLVGVHDRVGLTQGLFSLVLVVALLSALATYGIGIHAMFGAFALGVVLPHGTKLVSDLTSRMQDWIAVLLLPAFFAYAGLRTQLGLLDDLQSWLLCGLIIVVATVGKCSGAAVAARLTGSDWRESAAIGILMNTRGLMELIVLNIGHELGIISPKLYTMLVIMALVTTFMTAPVLQRIIRGTPLAPGSYEAIRLRVERRSGEFPMAAASRGEP